MKKQSKLKSLGFIATIVSFFLLNGCNAIIPKQLRSNPPNCHSYNYSNFMGHTKEWVIAQNITENWVFIGANNSIDKADDTRIAFYLEGNPEVVSGIGCN